jgi:hypothetical protein
MPPEKRTDSLNNAAAVGLPDRSGIDLDLTRGIAYGQSLFATEEASALTADVANDNFGDTVANDNFGDTDEWGNARWPLRNGPREGSGFDTDKESVLSFPYFPDLGPDGEELTINIEELEQLIQREREAGDSPELADNLINLSAEYRRQLGNDGRERSRTALLEAFEIRVRLYGEEAPIIVATLSYLFGTTLSHVSYKTSLEYAERAVSISERIIESGSQPPFMTDHYMTRLYRDLADGLALNGQHEKAQAVYARIKS